MPTEAEFATTPEARAGRALLEARLARLTPTERAVFDEAVRRCYACAPDEAAPVARAADDGNGRARPA